MYWDPAPLANEFLAATHMLIVIASAWFRSSAAIRHPDLAAAGSIGSEHDARAIARVARRHLGAGGVNESAGARRQISPLAEDTA
jgi:hypothetical protein